MVKKSNLNVFCPFCLYRYNETVIEEDKNQLDQSKKVKAYDAVAQELEAEKLLTTIGKSLLY